jgi:hypothetical protein
MFSSYLYLTFNLILEILTKPLSVFFITYVFLLLELCSFMFVHGINQITLRKVYKVAIEFLVAHDLACVLIYLIFNQYKSIIFLLHVYKLTELYSCLGSCWLLYAFVLIYYQTNLPMIFILVTLIKLARCFDIAGKFVKCKNDFESKVQAYNYSKTLNRMVVFINVFLPCLFFLDKLYLFPNLKL